MRKHQIKSPTGQRVLDIIEHDDGLTAMVLRNESNDRLISFSLDRGRQIALAFAALGGGSVDLSSKAEVVTSRIGSDGSDFTDDDLLVIARRALRAISNRHKKEAALKVAVARIHSTFAAHHIPASTTLIEAMAKAGLRVQN